MQTPTLGFQNPIGKFKSQSPVGEALFKLNSV